MTSWAGVVLAVLETGVIVYFLSFHTIQIGISIAAFVAARRRRCRWTRREAGVLLRSDATPGLSVIVPVCDDAAVTAARVGALLDSNLPQFEVIVVTDGSADRTLDRLASEFHLVAAPTVAKPALDTACIRGFYRSLDSQHLAVVDKEHAGEGDAINAGVNVARFELVCVVERESALDSATLVHAITPFLDNPATVAVGGVRRIPADSGVELEGSDAALPTERLAMLQTAEQLRTSWSAYAASFFFNGLRGAPGGVGVYRRAQVVEAGGFEADAFGESADLLIRLQQLCLRRGEPFRIAIQPDLVCRTPAARSLPELRRQRRRWQRSIVRACLAHPRALFNPRYGRIGMVALPCALIFQALGPMIETFGYALTASAVAVGVLDWRYGAIMLLAAPGYGAVAALASVVLQDLAAPACSRASDLLRLAWVSVLGECGYRQLLMTWRARSTLQTLRPTLQTLRQRPLDPQMASQRRSGGETAPFHGAPRIRTAL
jgi:cellulose synthase/poly-beta-1,6-N-acetylglucosamine synthase-like glycosyltransferase